MTAPAAALHDTAPEAPGAYDDGGGVGVLIEAARVLAAQPSRPRTMPANARHVLSASIVAGVLQLVLNMPRPCGNMTAAVSHNATE